MRRVPPRLPRRLPAPTAAEPAEREYFRDMRRYLEVFHRRLQMSIMEQLPELRQAAEMADLPDPASPERRDARGGIEKGMAKLFADVRRALMRAVPDKQLAGWARTMATRLNEGSKRSTARMAKPAGIEVEPLLNDKGMHPFFQDIVAENVALIRSIPNRRLEDLKNRLVAAIARDAPVDEIHAMVEKHFMGDKAHARLIARDQVGKLNGRLNQYRQQQIGGSRYVWRTSRDERVRGNPRGLYPHARHNHWEREGKVYSWDNPPAGGHPGQDIQCRCYAELVVEDLVDVA